MQANAGFEILQLKGAMAIPLGHRVEIIFFYSASGSGIFGTGAPEPMLKTPLITDLDTGVRYGFFDQFHAPVGMYTEGQTFDLSPQPLPRQEYTRFSGRVVICNVVHLISRDFDLQTTLVIERLPAGQPAYR